MKILLISVAAIDRANFSRDAADSNQQTGSQPYWPCYQGQWCLSDSGLRGLFVISSLCWSVFMSWWSLMSCSSVDVNELKISVCALILLVGRQEEHPACKNWVVRYWRVYLSGGRCIWFAYGPDDATATPLSLTPVEYRMIFLSGAGLRRLSWKKGH